MKNITWNILKSHYQNSMKLDNLKQKHDKPTSMKESRFFQDYLLQVLVSLQELVLLDLPFPTRKSATF